MKDFFVEDANNLNPNFIYCGTPKDAETNESNLGGNLYFGDAATFSSSIYKYVIDRFDIKSVLDVGSGLGFLPSYLSRNFDVSVIGMDGLNFNVENSLYPIVHCDLTKGSFKTTPVDLVTCVEVVEHIEEQYIDNLIDTLTQGRIILMTHALPGTNGKFHVNERNDHYWVEKLVARNYCLLVSDTYNVRCLAKQERLTAQHYTESTLLFGRLPKGVSMTGINSVEIEDKK